MGTDQVLEVLASERQLRLEAWQVDVDGRFGFGRQRFLGPPALVPKPCQGGGGRRVVRVHRDAIRADEAEHAAGERFVEVDPAEMLHLLGRPDFLESGLGLAQDRGIEGPATEVVDSDDRAHGEGVPLVIVDRRSLGLGQECHVLDAGLADRPLEQSDLVRAIARRVGQDDRIGRTTGRLADPRDDRPQQMSEQGVGSVQLPAEDDGVRVAETALEPARGAGRIIGRLLLCGVTDEHLDVGSEDDDRGHRCRLLTELDHLDQTVAGSRRRGQGGAEIDPERIRHRASVSIKSCES